MFGEHGAPVTALAGAGHEQRHSQDGLVTDVPGVAIRPADVPDGGGQRAEPRDSLKKAQPAVAHHEPAAGLEPPFVRTRAVSMLGQPFDAPGAEGYAAWNSAKSSPDRSLPCGL